MKLFHYKTLVALGAAGVALAGCGSGNALTAPHQANVATNSLQFAVGTANLFNAATALNVVATYRQPGGGYHPGDSGALTDTPTIVLPGAIAALTVGTPTAYDACSTVPTGPSTTELGTPDITSSSQVPGTTAVTSFGQSGGVFGLGIEPFNATGQADCTVPLPNETGTPFQVPPYAIPLYDASSPTNTATGDPNAVVAWGGPPAFVLPDSGGTSVAYSGNYPTGTAGISEGIDVFAGVAPVASGTYTLNVAVPANSGTITQSKSFTLPAGLKVIGDSVAPTFVPDAAGDGGGTLAVTLPANATEAYVEIVDYGPIQPAAGASSCNGSAVTNPNTGATSVYYTLETTTGGTLTLPPALGPGGAPTICTAAQNTAVNGGTATSDDQIAIQLISFDYDLYGASYPNSNGVPSPPQILANTSDDIGISPAICQVGATPCTPTALPLLRARKHGAAATIHRPAALIRR
ncbi:MAG: hypothetical protein ABR975_05290 [Vulcanimicrobiaceae bacterium]|jgi:hypothetical protein